MKKYQVAIIGAGIGGIHCAIELNKIGINTVLIEKNPYIGGMAVKIGKCFPNQDCASCISDSSFITQTQGIRKCLYKFGLEDFPKYNSYLNTLIEDISKNNNDFIIKLIKKPNYIQDNCNDCGKCEESCPIFIKDAFNCNLVTRKVISLPFDNAIPHKRTLERNSCKDCKEECVKACDIKAINLQQKEEKIEIVAEFLVIASGFNEFNIVNIPEYGSGSYSNVITQLQVARMLDPSGPTHGKILKPSDWKPPKNILISLCSGSRDIRYKDYCSRICCSYSLKHAIELSKQGINVYFSYMDLRLQEESLYYLKEAKKQNIHFIQNKIAKIEEDIITKQLEVSCENTEISQMLFDLVILTPALEPANGINFLDNNLNIKIGANGFIHADEWGFKGRNQYSQKIYSIGCIDSPKNIPKTVTQAKAISFSIISSLEGDS